jgi:hypothetical protein
MKEEEEVGTHTTAHKKVAQLNHLYSRRRRTKM